MAAFACIRQNFFQSKRFSDFNKLFSRIDNYLNLHRQLYALRSLDSRAYELINCSRTLKVNESRRPWQASQQPRFSVNGREYVHWNSSICFPLEKVFSGECWSTVISKQKFSSNDSIQFDAICEETLESLANYFEELIGIHLSVADTDVALSDGVLTINLGVNYGIYVINKQSPNQQIWLSSPISGPKRYDLVGNQWIYRHDGVSLHQLLTKEISEVFTANVDFTQCDYGK